MVFGSFDGIHPGHLYFLKKAKSLGDHLTILIARDETIHHLKKKKPVFSTDERKRQIMNLDIADEVIIGSVTDVYEGIRKVKPQIIALGYDQIFFTQHLQERLAENGINITVIRIGPFQEKIYKSSLLKKSKDL